MPGAGSVIAANWLFNTANPQELNIGTFSPSLYLQQLGGQTGVQFKFEDFRWLASVATVNNTCFARTDTGISSFDQLLSSGGSSLAVGASPSDSIYSNLLIDELDANIQLATGYQGSADLLAAIEEGVVDARCGVPWSNTKALRPDWIEDDFIRPFLSLTLGDGHPDLMDSVPRITEYRDRFKTEIGWQVLQLAIVPDSIFRPYVAPPGTPDDVVQALREAFWAMMQDARFVRDLANADRPVIPVAGADVERIVKDAIGGASQEAFDLFRELT
ncbi:MAG: hypothetical protein C1O27_002663 [Chloroflexi bacterium]|nr:MAG: hypothetical protein C1O27_002663 [Chloroflexota bacterium]